jgi:hypothetical protein
VEVLLTWVAHSWTENLAKFFKEQNLEVVHDETLSNPDIYQPVTMQTLLLVYEQFHLQQPEGSPLKQLQQQLRKEAQAGAFVNIGYKLVVGRKAEA